MGRATNGKYTIEDGKVRVTLFIEENLLRAIDGVAKIEKKPRSDILMDIIDHDFSRKGFDKHARQYPEFIEYWLEKMRLYPLGTFAFTTKNEYDFPSNYTEGMLEDGGSTYYEHLNARELFDRFLTEDECVDKMTEIEDKIAVLNEKYQPILDPIFEKIEREHTEQCQRMQAEVDYVKSICAERLKKINAEYEQTLDKLQDKLRETRKAHLAAGGSEDTIPDIGYKNCEVGEMAKKQAREKHPIKHYKKKVAQARGGK